MGRLKHISEGRSACYGRQSSDDYSEMLTWRNRLHNERGGMSNKDNTGVNTTCSLMWNPGNPRGNQYALSSHKRMSELKRIQDFGVGAGTTPRPPRSAVNTMAYSEPPSPVLQRPMTVAPSLISARMSGMSSGSFPTGESTHYLDTETGRLQASAHARQIGQTFLLAGNLPQAKAFLAKAEQLLQVDKKYLPKDY